MLGFLYAEFVLSSGTQSSSHVPPILLLAFLLTDVTVGYFFKPRLRVNRHLPSHATAGERIRLTYELHNASSMPAWDLTIDSLPLPRDIEFPDGRAVVNSIDPHTTVTAVTDIRARERGRYVLAEPRVDSSFPFHLWRWGRNGNSPRQIAIYPRFTELERLDMSFSTRYQPGGVAYSSDVGSSKEFLSCREYRYGDEIRHLHQRSWARLGIPIVKEFREEYLCRTALILDTHRPLSLTKRVRARDQTFEAAVSLTAATAAWLARQEYLVELFAAGPQVYRFESGRSLAYLEDILDVLSCIEHHPDEPMTDLRAIVEDEKLKLSSAVLMLTVWNDTRRQLIRTLKEAGVAVKTVLINQTDHRPADLPPEVVCVSAADVQEGRCLAL